MNSNERIEIFKLIKELKQKIEHNEKIIPIYIKIMALIGAYMYQCPILTPSLLNDYFYILELAPRLFDSMIEITLVKISMKQVPFKILKHVIHFCQGFLQGLLTYDSPYLQLPYLNESFRMFLSNKKKLPTLPFKKFIESSNNFQKLKGLDENETKQLESYIKVFPQIDVNVKYFIEGFDDLNSIYIGDILTIDVEIIRKNYNKDRVF